MNNSIISWGIIGCGNVTEVKSGPAFNKVPGSVLTAVMRRDAAKAKDYAERHHVPKWYADAHELINDPGITAIYVATPPKYHEEYAIAAMRAGKPVYVEKPMSTSLAACQRMKTVAEETGIKLCVAHYRRALPKFMRIKELLNQNYIGDIRTVSLSLLQPDQSSMIAHTETNWRVDPDMAGAGLFFDLAPHQLDILVYFFGEAVHATGIAANQAGLYPAEDVVTGLAQFGNGALFSGQWCFTVAAGLDEDRIEINGSEGKISFSVFGHEIKISKGEETELVNFTAPAHIQQPMIEKVVQYFSGTGENPCSAATAIVSMDIMEKFTSPLQESLRL